MCLTLVLLSFVDVGANKPFGERRVLGPKPTVLGYTPLKTGAKVLFCTPNTLTFWIFKNGPLKSFLQENKVKKKSVNSKQ